MILLLNNLPSGYHRDLQLTKEIVFPAIESLSACLQMLIFSLPQVQVKENILQDEKYKYLFSVEAVNDFVNKGVSFRDAYKRVGENLESLHIEYKNFDPLTHTHEGSMGNLHNEEITLEFNKVLQKFS